VEVQAVAVDFILKAEMLPIAMQVSQPNIMVLEEDLVE
jgi:hypothetical protein